MLIAQERQSARKEFKAADEEMQRAVEAKLAAVEEPRRPPPRPTSIQTRSRKRAEISASSPPAPIPAAPTPCSGACPASAGAVGHDLSSPGLFGGNNCPAKRRHREP